MSHCPAIDPAEAEQLTTAVKQWLAAHEEGVVVHVAADKEGFMPIDTHHGGHPTRRLMFAYSSEDTYFSFGFKSEVQDDWTTETAKKEFHHVALDKLPVPGLKKPKNWNIYPQTPTSSFEDGFEWELFDVKNKRVKFHVKTNAFCIYGTRNDLPHMGCGKSPAGSYLSVRQSIPVDLTVDLPITIG